MVVMLLVAHGILTIASAQTSNDSTQTEYKPFLFSRKVSTKTEKERNLRFSILGGPSYNPDRGITLGATTLFTFDAKGMRGTAQRSTVPLIISLAYAHELGYSVRCSPMLFLNKDKLRISGNFLFAAQESHYHGVGFATNKENKKSTALTYYFANSTRFNPTINFRINNSKWFMGPIIDLVYDKMLRPSQGVINDTYYQQMGGDNLGYSTLNSGVGISANYDSRDIISTPYKGMLFEFNITEYHKYLGSDNSFGLIRLGYRQFVSLSEQKAGRTLGWIISTDISHGNVPLMHLPTLGSMNNLRGYYGGQYRDKAATLTMVEYRHKFHAERTSFINHIIDRLGFATWIGCGFIGPQFYDISGVMPNIGEGLRFEVQPRLNFRFDVGYSPLENQVLFYFSVAESF